MRNLFAKRIIDIVLVLLFLTITLIPMLVVWFLIRFSSRGPVVHWSSRVGQNNKLFAMPKFRTMQVDAPDVATHLIDDPDKYITSIGKWLRKHSMDELPQLWSILRGRMSFIGPRPALFNQHDLVELRTQKGIHLLMPGLTGWAQVNGRDELTIEEKVGFDEHYLMNRSLAFDMRILYLTALKVLRHEGIIH